jgi:hypothetical protein
MLWTYIPYEAVGISLGLQDFLSLSIQEPGHPYKQAMIAGFQIYLLHTYGRVALISIRKFGSRSGAQIHAPAALVGYEAAGAQGCSWKSAYTGNLTRSSKP